MYQFLLYIEAQLLKKGFLSLFTDVTSKHRGGTVVKVLCYKSEGRWFDPS